MNKEEIRNRVKARKSLLTAAEKRAAAYEVFRRLEQSAAFALSENILLYHSLPDELPTREFLDKWAERKHFFLPRVNGVNLDILPYDRSRMALGAFQIEEPQGDDVADISQIEMVVVPAVAYDRRGYYDRLLSSTRAAKVGVGFDFQLLDEEIPSEPHDVAVDMVITESRRIVIRHLPRRR